MESNRASWGPGQERKNTETLVAHCQIPAGPTGNGCGLGKTEFVKRTMASCTVNDRITGKDHLNRSRVKDPRLKSPAFSQSENSIL